MACEWLGTDLEAAIARAEALNRLWDEVRLNKSAKTGPMPGTLAWMAQDIETSE